MPTSISTDSKSQLHSFKDPGTEVVAKKTPFYQGGTVPVYQKEAITVPAPVDQSYC